MKRHEDDFTCRLKRLRARQRHQRLQMLKAIGCCLECQVRQIQSHQFVHTFNLFRCDFVEMQLCTETLISALWNAMFRPPMVATFPLKGVFVVNGIQFCSMPGFFGEAPVLAPDEAQRAVDLKEYPKKYNIMIYNDYIILYYIILIYLYWHILIYFVICLAWWFDDCKIEIALFSRLLWL